MLLNLAIAVLVTPVLLIPWTVQVATHPALLLLEAGAAAPGLATPDLPARSLLLLSPGGPGLPVFWVTAGIVVAALAALLLSQRRALIAGRPGGWRLFGLLAAVAESRAVVTRAGHSGRRRPGPACPGRGRRRRAWCSRPWPPATPCPARWKAAAGGATACAAARLGLAVVAPVACSAPVLAAASWVTNGVQRAGRVGPPARGARASQLSSANGLRLRTLVLRAAARTGHLHPAARDSAAHRRTGPGPRPAAARALNSAVATLVAPNGGEAADQGQSWPSSTLALCCCPRRPTRRWPGCSTAWPGCGR